MKTEFCKITDTAADIAAIRKAADILRRGGLVGMPTETVYGLAANARDSEAAAKIYAAKGRPSDNPLIVHIAEPRDAETLAYVPEVFYRLADAFMPGPLTVILPKKPCVPDGVTGGLQTVALRCPSHPVAQALIRESGLPIAAPSANRSGCPSPTTAEHVLRDMDGRIEMILDGGPCDIGLESTVIRLTENGCEILRPGAVTELMLARVCGTVSVSKAVVDPGLAGDKPISPGMKYKHYSPNAEVVLIDASENDFAAYVQSHCGEKDAVAAADSDADRYCGCRVLSIGRTENAQSSARRMFALLREADDCGCSRIFVRMPPAEGDYLALYNRLIRAAGGKIVHLNTEN